MIRKLQILHIGLLFLVPILFVLFRINSHPGDEWRDAFDVVMEVLGGVWLSLTVISAVIWGLKEDTKVSLIATYRRFLTRVSFLCVSNLVLAGAVFVLGQQLAMYREVEFWSNLDVEVYLSDDIGNDHRIGVLKANQLTKFRLHIGRRHLVFKDIANDEVLDTEALEISPIWKDRSPIAVKKEIEKDKYEETTP
jgi:hypothetical protein